MHRALPRATPHTAPQLRPSGAASPDPPTPTPTLLARAGASLPPGAGPSLRQGVLPAVLDEADELIAPVARAAVEQLGYAVPSVTAAALDATSPSGCGGAPVARFVGVHGLDGVVRCRLRGRHTQPALPATFTVAYVLRDELAAALHRLHCCADVVVVLKHTANGPRFLHVPWPSLFEQAGVTAREADVLALLLARRTNAEIARALVVSTATVRAHCRSVFCKLGAAGRRDLWLRFDRFEGRVA